MKRSLSLFIMIAATLGVLRPAHAQLISHGDLFGPGAPPPMVGIELGFGKHQQQGTFFAACGCTFQDGTGTGLVGSLVFELPLDYEWSIGLKAGIDFKNTSSTTAGLDSTVIANANPNGKDTSYALGYMAVDRTGTVKTTYAVIAPYVQYQFFRMGPFVQVGPSIGFLIANHFNDLRTLPSTTASVGGTDYTDLRFQTSGTTEETAEDGAITDVSSLRIGLLISAGYNISVSERSVLSPLLTYDFPITPIRTSLASGWKIGSLYASAVLKFKLD